MNNINLLFLCIATFFVTQVYSSSHHEKMLLEDLKSFTVYKHRKTEGRRSRVLQLECVEGDACQYYQPHSMQCRQVGFDGFNASWKCEAQLEDYYYIGYTKVSCEGYHNPNDKYITRGSCGVRYSLYLTEKGKEHFRYYDDYSYDSNHHHHSSNNNNNSSGGGSSIFIFISIAVVVYIIYKISKKNNKNNTTNTNDDQPPPYGSWDNDYESRRQDEEYMRRNNNRNNNSSSSSTFSSTAQRVGDFVSGYMVGNSMRNRNRDNRTTNNYFYGSSSSRSRTRSRSRSRSRSRQRTPSPPRTYTSYGFGDTERR